MTAKGNTAGSRSSKAAANSPFGAKTPGIKTTDPKLPGEARPAPPPKQPAPPKPVAKAASIPPPPPAPPPEPPPLSAEAKEYVPPEGTQPIAPLGAQLLDSRAAIAAKASRLIDELLLSKPEVLVPLVDRFASGAFSESTRTAQTSANALPVMARLAPARVARHLQALTDRFAQAPQVAKDGLVRTYAALCSASVAYQKRLEAVLDEALSEAEPKVLLRWTEIVLPALKGEPHARARAVVERRVHELPKPYAQKLADYLGIKLRRPVP